MDSESARENEIGSVPVPESNEVESESQSSETRNDENFGVLATSENLVDAVQNVTDVVQNVANVVQNVAEDGTLTLAEEGNSNTVIPRTFSHDTNLNVVECYDIFWDARCDGSSKSQLHSFLHQDAPCRFIVPPDLEFQIYLETNGQPSKVASPPASEETSIYYDALETQAEDESDDDSVSYTIGGGVKPRKRSCVAKWCCCCCRKPEKYEEPEDDIDDTLFLATDDTKSTTQDKATSDTNTVSKARSNRRLRSAKSKVSSKAVNVASRDFGPAKLPHERRKRVPERPDKNMSLWGVLKHAMSKDISRSPLPVHFSEPLSMLQRLAEDYEYSDLLDKASRSEDALEQLCYVAAFTVASYCNTAIRTYKPFNPLLGETFELDRMDDMGFKYISEQVSHHPPTAATHCEGAAGWICWQDLTMYSKWHMNTCDFNPTGVAHLTFTASGHHYTWKKVTTVVHNLIMGKLWVDQVGDAVVINHITGDTCKLQFLPNGRKQVTGTVATKSGQVKMTISGNWDDQLTATPKPSGYPLLLWKIKRPASGSDKYYYMTEFACQLNEMEPGIAPTDSRLRPDQRLMENGLFDEANAEKGRLEDKQRREAKKWESDEPKSVSTSSVTVQKKPYTPRWFKKGRDDTTSQVGFVYTQMYWERKRQKNWAMCPNIY